MFCSGYRCIPSCGSNKLIFTPISDGDSMQDLQINKMFQETQKKYIVTSISKDEASKNSKVSIH